MNTRYTVIPALLLSAVLGSAAFADSPDGHMNGAEDNPWQQQGMPAGQPMDPRQMDMMRRQQMMQGGPAMGPGPQGGMMDPQMMQMMRQQRMQMMQSGGPGMQGGPGSQHRGGMMPPMMQQMMKQRDRHWQQVEQRLANIENLLQQLVDLQKK